MAFRERPDRDNDPDNSGLLFNTLRSRLNLRSERSLARWLDIASSHLSKIRHGECNVSPAIILRVHESTGMPVKEIRRLIESGTVPNLSTGQSSKSNQNE